MNVLLLCAALFISFSSLAAERVISVTGHCKLTSAPDRFSIQMRIIKLQKNPEESLNSANELFNKLKKEIETSGVVIKVNAYQTFEQKEWEKDKSVSKGFNTTISFNAESDEQIKIAQIIPKLAKYNIEAIDNISTALSDKVQKKLEFECLELAVKNAEEKAKVMSGAVGAKILKVRQIQEQQSIDSYPRPGYEAGIAMMKAERSVTPQLPDSKIEFKRSVQVEFELE